MRIRHGSVSFSVHFSWDAVGVAARPLTILVDHRERSSGVTEVLRALRVEVRETTLPLGDYMVARGVGIERKTVADLHRSIRDRRLWFQVASLRADLDMAYLFIEGADIDRGPISRAGVRGALLEVASLGISVIRALDVQDTALWLVGVAKREQRAGLPRRSSRTRPRRPVTPTSILCEIPGISPRLANQLIERFGSLAGVAEQSPRDLMRVPGIGRERAMTLRRLLAGAIEPHA